MKGILGPMIPRIVSREGRRIVASWRGMWDLLPFCIRSHIDANAWANELNKWRRTSLHEEINTTHRQKRFPISSTSLSCNCRHLFFKKISRRYS